MYKVLLFINDQIIHLKNLASFFTEDDIPKVLIEDMDYN